MTTFINFTIYEPFLLKYAQICAGGCEHTSDQIQKNEIYIRGLEPYLKWYSMQPAWIQGFVAWNRVSSKKSSFIEGHSIFMVSYDEKFTIFTCMTLIIICPAVSLPLLTLDSGATAMVSCDRVQLVELLSTTLTTSLAYHII